MANAAWSKPPLMGSRENSRLPIGAPDLPTDDSVLFSVRFCAVHPKDAGDCRLLHFFRGLLDEVLEKAKGGLALSDAGERTDTRWAHGFGRAHAISISE